MLRLSICFYEIVYFKDFLFPQNKALFGQDAIHSPQDIQCALFASKSCRKSIPIRQAFVHIRQELHTSRFPRTSFLENGTNNAVKAPYGQTYRQNPRLTRSDSAKIKIKNTIVSTGIAISPAAQIQNAGQADVHTRVPFKNVSRTSSAKTPYEKMRIFSLSQCGILFDEIPIFRPISPKKSKSVPSGQSHPQNGRGYKNVAAIPTIPSVIPAMYKIPSFNFSIKIGTSMIVHGHILCAPAAPQTILTVMIKPAAEINCTIDLTGLLKNIRFSEYFICM